MQRFVKRGRPSRFIEALTNDDVGVLKKLVLQDSGSVETEWPGHLCCQHGAHACLSFLIDCCGLDVDDVTAKGTLTALHIACQHRRQRCVSALIARGALVEAAVVVIQAGGMAGFRGQMRICTTDYSNENGSRKRYYTASSLTPTSSSESKSAQSHTAVGSLLCPRLARWRPAS